MELPIFFIKAAVDTSVAELTSRKIPEHGFIGSGQHGLVVVRTLPLRIFFFVTVVALIAAGVRCRERGGGYRCEYCKKQASQEH